MSKIKNIIAKEIKDSRGNPTVEVELETEKGSYISSCPAGASTGKNEAIIVDVQKAIENVNNIIAPKLRGKDALDQTGIDGELDHNLGANAILPVSMAVCRAGAGAKKIPLYRHISELSGQKMKIPLAMFNIINGGKHVRGQSYLDIQEFIIIPEKKTFAENLVLCNKIFQNLQKAIEENFGKTELGDEGGFALAIPKTEQALYLLKNAIGADDAKIALDCAASSFFVNGKYSLDGRELTRTELLEIYQEFAKAFPVISIEDPYAEEDWQGFEEITREMGKKICIVGDDLTTTNIKRIKEAYNKNACNGVILKLNQIGTVSETMEAGNLAKSFGWKTIISHRSGETMDDFIADLAVGLGTDYLKAGSPAKPERMVKYSRLMEIEQELK